MTEKLFSFPLSKAPRHLSWEGQTNTYFGLFKTPFPPPLWPHFSLGTTLHIIGARRLVRSICRSSITCRKVMAATEKQMMGQLPHPRVTPSPSSLLELAWTLLEHSCRRRITPANQSLSNLLVCFSTKATHLESVSDLSTESFIAALKRFVSRRGLPQELYSDNGSNFKGAANDLNELYSFMHSLPFQNSLSSYLLSQKITWNFSPERAPHFGRLWEAAIKSAKHHLK